MADLADHAYAHACAVLGPGASAVEAAVIAVRRGGRSRSAVLGHARDGVLALADVEEGGVDLDATAPDDLTELAEALAATRPAVERVIVDLEARHGLDRGGFARSLGLAVGPAGARAAAVFLDWQQLLDPVVLARLGPGGCDGLAAILGAPTSGPDEPDPARPFRSSTPDPADNSEMDGLGGPASTLRELVEVGPAVAEHATGCALCGDRLRSMVSVRTLLGQRPVQGLAPAAVRDAAAPSRLRRPTLPPPLVPAGPARRWLRPVVTAAVAVAFAATGGVVAAALRHRPDDEARQVRALTRVPVAGTALSVDRPVIEGTTPPPVVLTNRSDRAIEWIAAADVAWLQVTPSEGMLEPGARSQLRVGVTSDAPEGPVRGAVRISGTDGSATLVRLATTVERPPEVAATSTGCDVAVTVEDEGEVRAVELHWVEGASTERVVALPSVAAGYTGRLPNGQAPTEWWVTASDARGNTARTPDENLAAGTCP